jgi:hypothetical protein
MTISICISPQHQLPSNSEHIHTSHYITALPPPTTRCTRCCVIILVSLEFKKLVLDVLGVRRLEECMSSIPALRPLNTIERTRGARRPAVRYRRVISITSPYSAVLTPAPSPSTISTSTSTPTSDIIVSAPSVVIVQGEPVAGSK